MVIFSESFSVLFPSAVLSFKLYGETVIHVTSASIVVDLL